MSDSSQHVAWFRSSAPYINAHRGRTFVVQFGGEAVIDAAFPSLVHDLALLDSLGIRLVLVHGARPQIEERVARRGLTLQYVNGLRVTDDLALEAVKEAAGAVRLEIEALLSMGLPNSPMAGARIRVASGNFVTARPLGVRDGIDFRHTGDVRRVDVDAIRRQLDDGAVVLVSPVGYSPTGEMFNVHAEDVATAVAIELKAAKLLFLGETEVLVDADGVRIGELTLSEARALLAELRGDPARRSERDDQLESAIRACQYGVNRAHLLDRHVDGALLLELFTRDGVGSMVSADPYDAIRRATIDDVGGILGLIEPLEAAGQLVRRSREKLEMEIGHFHVVERDGTVIGCAAAYPFPDEAVVELACLAVHGAYRNAGRGDTLLETIEREACGLGARRLFVLTTQASHWFKERGFVDATIDELPVGKKGLYNYHRNSKVLIKALPG